MSNLNIFLLWLRTTAATENRRLAKLLVLVCACTLSTNAVAASIEGFLSPGALSEAHAAFEGNCEACHSPLTETKQQTLCLTCHAEVGSDLKSSAGFHGRHPKVGPEQCQSCHREHKGRSAKTLAFDLDGLNHDHTDFPLRWKHAETACVSCHTNTQRKTHKFTEAATECSACHTKDDVHQGNLGTDCASCHSARGWKPTLFDHSNTSFPLLGSHATTTCTACHSDGTETKTPSQCSSCHNQDDAHQGSFGTNCQSCHTTQNWQQSTFKPYQHKIFPLEAGHSNLSCNDCHSPSESLADIQGKTCNSCHATDDVHKGNNGSQCETCHSTTSWQESRFQHAEATGFALNGTHSKLSCNQCHEGAVSEPISNTCNGCHSPDPHANQLGNNCAQCHNESQWTGKLSFSHELTNFPLLGKHSPLECSACHLSSKFHDVDPQCSSCHQQDDPHQQAMGSNCGSCHNPASWTVQRFDHQEVSGFPLIGQHQKASCDACHQSPARMRARGPDECSTCHQQDDPHQNRFGTDCVQCHNNQSFRDIKRL